ncbi:hypothetical protein PUMCH_004678 [Australozyma saopauloensis]|uniref:C3HC-type domain-containing protein n=1 Tax=Australozyma saopauloensis TaxID=291208 RepID=A0AAX4HH60_9ASCO|nr:hypothetical protein PUMCH_004678 [[Candida] saopauloensis]
MDSLNFAANTPRVLNQCLALLDQPARPTATFSVPLTPKKYENHPDIQFFSSIKKKHHFEYHKLKKNSTRDAWLDKSTVPMIHSGKSTSFDPYSRADLLHRISTFNALNWSIPPSSDLNESGTVLPSTLNELFCALNGWACEPISRNNNFSNHLKCSVCEVQLILRFNSVDEASYGKFLFDMEDIVRLNDNLKVSYLSEIRHGAHSQSCPWKSLSCSLQGIYYMTPYVSATNATLVTEYLLCLKNLIDNLPALENMGAFCQTLVPSGTSELDEHFVRVSKMWFLDRFYTDTKENFAAVLDFVCPPWIYKVAALGWKLSLQSHQEDTVLLMTCDCCNQRLFVEQHMAEGVVHSHKPWCMHMSYMGQMSFYEYFYRLIALLEKSIGPHGEYLVDQELSFDMDPLTNNRKRRESFDINDGLDRLTKLRKMYFVS